MSRLIRLQLALLCYFLYIIYLCYGTIAMENEEKESIWGRIYLRNGLSPIQYFRDSFGGKMLANEARFYFPEDRAYTNGCNVLPSIEVQALGISSHPNAMNETVPMVLVVDRGVCTFTQKARNAQEMGFAAVIIINMDDENLKGPVGIVDEDLDGPITIASVLIRRSGGDALKAISKQMQSRKKGEQLYGRLIPMTCTKEYICTGRNPIENEYIAQSGSGGGILSIIQSDNEKTSIGEYLGATYGTIVPSVPLNLVRNDSFSPHTGCSVLHPNKISEQNAFQGKAVIVRISPDCSILDKVSNIQRAGAFLAIISLAPGQALLPASVVKSWHAYNITIGVITVSDHTASSLQLHSIETQDEIQLRMQKRNEIAHNWGKIAPLEMKESWPKSRKKLKTFLQTRKSELQQPLSKDQFAQLKSYFIDVARGTDDIWNSVMLNIEANVKHERVNDEL